MKGHPHRRTRPLFSDQADEQLSPRSELADRIRGYQSALASSLERKHDLLAVFHRLFQRCEQIGRKSSALQLLQ
jgi:hypothetical protein